MSSCDDAPVPVELLQLGRVYWTYAEGPYYEMADERNLLQQVVAIKRGDVTLLVSLNGPLLSAARYYIERTLDPPLPNMPPVFRRCHGVAVYGHAAHEFCYRTREAALRAAVTEAMQRVPKEEKHIASIRDKAAYLGINEPVEDADD